MNNRPDAKLKVKQAYLLYRNRKWEQLKEYFHEDIILWTPERKSYYNSPDAVIQYLRNLLPPRLQKPDFFIEKKEMLNHPEVYVIEAGRYTASDIAEIHGDISCIFRKGQFKILSIFLQNPSQFYEKIRVRTKDKTRYWINKKSIVCIEATRNCSILYLADKSILNVAEPISTLEVKLGPAFLQVHRSYLVNPHYINSLQHRLLITETGMQIPIPEKRYAFVKKALSI